MAKLYNSKSTSPKALEAINQKSSIEIPEFVPSLSPGQYQEHLKNNLRRVEIITVEPEYPGNFNTFTEIVDEKGKYFIIDPNLGKNDL